MSWQARCLFFELLRKVDGDGVLKVGRFGVSAIAIAIRAPLEEIEGPFGELVAPGRLVWEEETGKYIVPDLHDWCVHGPLEDSVETEETR